MVQSRRALHYDFFMCALRAHFAAMVATRGRIFDQNQNYWYAIVSENLETLFPLSSGQPQPGVHRQLKATKCACVVDSLPAIPTTKQRRVLAVTRQTAPTLGVAKRDRRFALTRCWRRGDSNCRCAFNVSHSLVESGPRTRQHFGGEQFHGPSFIRRTSHGNGPAVRTASLQ